MDKVRHMDVLCVFIKNECLLQKTQFSTTDEAVIVIAMENRRPVIMNSMCKCMTPCPGKLLRSHLLFALATNRSSIADFVGPVRTKQLNIVSEKVALQRTVYSAQS